MEIPHEETTDGITHGTIFDKLRSEGQNINQANPSSLDTLRKFVTSGNGVLDSEEETEKKLESFVRILTKKWKESSYSELKFRAKNLDWLKKVLFFKASSQNSSAVSLGRPQKPFAECSDKSKRRKVDALIKNHSVEELTFACESALRESGSRSKASIIRQISSSSSSSEEIKNIKIILDPDRTIYKKPTPLLPMQALGFLINNRLTKQQYMSVRLECKNRNANIYPAYALILEAKKECLPPRADMIITEISAEIPLQCLLDLTSSRLLQAHEASIMNSVAQEQPKLRLVWKYGFDGSSNQSLYHQSFSAQFGSSSDGNLFVVCSVPLVLRTLDVDAPIIWQNPVPGSSRYCRPLKFIFEKESSEVVTNYHDMIQNEIRHLKASVVTIGDINFEVTHELNLTMIDTKSSNTLTGNSAAQKCFLCDCSPIQMNELDRVRARPVQIQYFRLGMSTLHAWLKVYENLLHIGYRLKIKAWRITKPEHKLIFAEEKKRTQKEFKDRIGIVVDKPKQGGGNSNCGNVARRFFQNSAISAEITGLNEELIKRFHVVLAILASGRAINVDLLRQYLTETANLYVKEYQWYYMSATTHKLLIHGADIVASFSLPIGLFTEEALEASNKSYRLFRREFSRKIDRTTTNFDIFTRLLISSDPVILNFQKLKKKKKTLPEGALSLLADTEIEDEDGEEDETEDEDVDVDEDEDEDEDEDGDDDQEADAIMDDDENMMEEGTADEE